MVVAAGEGTRLGADMPKAFVPVAGRRMVAWSIAALRESDRVAHIVVVAPPERASWATAALGRDAAAVEVVEGGSSRAVSVARGVAATSADAEVILVHDAARPLVAPTLIRAVVDGMHGADGAIAAHPVADTLKAAAAGGRIDRTVAREGLWAAETPQAFRADPFREALARALAEGTLDAMTDCASVMEAAGHPVRIVASTAPNPKVTTPADLTVAEVLLAARAGGAPVV